MKLSLRLNAVLKILLSIANILIPFFVGPYVIRVLSRSSYDSFTKATAEIQLFLTLATGAIHVYGVRTISQIRKDKEKVAEFFSEAFAIGLVLNSVFLGGYLLYAGRYREAIYYVLALQFIGSSLQVEWLNKRKKNIFFITLKSLFVKAVYLASVFAFLKTDNPSATVFSLPGMYWKVSSVSYTSYGKTGCAARHRPQAFRKLALAF